MSLNGKHLIEQIEKLKRIR